MIRFSGAESSGNPEFANLRHVHWFVSGLKLPSMIETHIQIFTAQTRNLLTIVRVNLSRFHYRESAHVKSMLENDRNPAHSYIPWQVVCRAGHYVLDLCGVNLRITLFVMRILQTSFRFHVKTEILHPVTELLVIQNGLDCRVVE
jgi:hypothetical protein